LKWNCSHKLNLEIVSTTLFHLQNIHTSKNNISSSECYFKKKSGYLYFTPFHLVISYFSFIFNNRDSDYGNEETAEYVKEEKRRKQREAVADDLFINNQKVSPILFPYL
jgi:hypothetical protein